MKTFQLKSFMWYFVVMIFLVLLMINLHFLVSRCTCTFCLSEELFSLVSSWCNLTSCYYILIKLSSFYICHMMLFSFPNAVLLFYEKKGLQSLLWGHIILCKFYNLSWNFCFLIDTNFLCFLKVKSFSWSYLIYGRTYLSCIHISFFLYGNQVKSPKK